MTAVVTPPTSRPLARATEHLAAGRLAEAAGAFKAVLQIDPNEVQGHMGLAQCAVGRRQHDVAYEHFVRAAEILRARGQAEDALVVYGYALTADPQRIDLHVDIAELEAETGRREAALQRLESLAEAYLAADREEDAIAILEFMNEWSSDEVQSPAPEMFEPGAFEAGAIAAPVRDTEGTMVIQTFLLTPEGRPFVPGEIPSVPTPVTEPHARITQVPTHAPRGFGAEPPTVVLPAEPPASATPSRSTVVPTAAPTRSTIVPTAAPKPARSTLVPTAAPKRSAVPTMGTPAPVVDEPSADVHADAPAREGASWELPAPPSFHDDEELDDATRRASNPLPAIVSVVLDEDSHELAALAVADIAAIDAAIDALPGSAPIGEPETDATAVRAKPLPRAQPAPSSVDAQGRSLAERLRTTRSRAATPTGPQPTVAAKPNEGRPAPRTAPPIGAGTNAAGTPSGRPASAPTTAAKPSTRAATPAATARPSTTSQRPSPTPQRPSTAPQRPSTAPQRTTAPAPTRTPAPSKPAAPARPTASSKPATPSKPAARPTTPVASRPAAAPRPMTTPPIGARTPAPARPSAAPRPAAPTPTRPTTAAKPAATTRTAVAPRPGANAPRPSAPAAAPRNAAAAKPSAPARASTPAPDKRTDANKRVMAVRTRAPAPAPGVPTAVAPGRTLPMVIPPPPREELDDQNTVIFRGEP